MSRDASIILEWADGSYIFRLRQGELIQLQEYADAGPMWVLNRMMNPTPENKGWRVQDISHVIRLGLIGGGMEPGKALRLTKDYVDTRPPVENLLFAQAILAAGLMGVAKNEKKSAPETEEESTTSPEGSGDGPRSSASAAP